MSKINQKLLREIKEMAEADQELRFLWSDQELSKPLKNWDLHNNPGVKFNLQWGLINYLVYFIDSTHNIRIHRIIQKYGYPTTKLIGKKGMSYFWILIQHQDYDTDLQEVCLANCGFASKDVVYLTDRVLINQGQKQRYGTQFKRDPKTKQIISQPIANVKEVDKRRKEVGLGPLKESLDFMNKKFIKK